MECPANFRDPHKLKILEMIEAFDLRCNLVKSQLFQPIEKQEDQEDLKDREEEEEFIMTYLKKVEASTLAFIKRCREERPLLRAQSELLISDAKNIEDELKIIKLKRSVVDVEIKTVNRRNRAKRFVDQETQCDATVDEVIEKNESVQDGNDVHDDDDEKTVVGMSAYEHEACHSFQILRQLLHEQRPDSQDEWLEHVKAIEDIYFEDS